MPTLKLAVIATILVFALGVILSLTTTAKTIGETAAEWSPENQAEATIALDRRTDEARATRVYLDVLSNEVVSDTQNTHALMRQADAERHERAMQLESVGNVAKMAGAVSFAGAVSIAALGAGLAFARRVNVVHLKDGAHLLPSGMWIDTRTALVSGTKRERIPAMHAKDLLEFRAVVVKSLVGAFVENGGVKLLGDGE